MGYIKVYILTIAISAICLNQLADISLAAAIEKASAYLFWGIFNACIFGLLNL